MPVDKDVQDYVDNQLEKCTPVFHEFVEGRLAQQELRLRDYFDSLCRPRCHTIRQELTGIQSTVMERESETAQLKTVLETVKIEVSKVAKLLEGNGHGSIDTQLQLMHQEQGYLRDMFNSAITERKEATVSRKELLQRSFIAAIPQLMQWVVILGCLIFFGRGFGGPPVYSNSTTTSSSGATPPAALK